MLDKAIIKLKAEMDQNKTNSYIQVVGDFIIQYVKENQEVAEKILVEEKTILKSLNEMKKAAEKKKVGNCAVLSDQEGFKIVLQYFGIEADPTITQTPLEPKVEIPEIKHKNNDFDINLEDLI